MHTRPALLTLTFTILALLIGLPVPDATYSADTAYSGAPPEYAGIEDDEPNPLPRTASPEDKQLLDDLYSRGEAPWEVWKNAEKGPKQPRERGDG